MSQRAPSFHSAVLAKQDKWERVLKNAIEVCNGKSRQVKHLTVFNIGQQD